MIAKERFFDEGVQRFLGLLHGIEFKRLTERLQGYDLQFAGKMIFPGNSAAKMEKTPEEASPES